MSPRRKNVELDNVLSNELSEAEMSMISGGIGRCRAKCPVPGCNFESSMMTELNAHMKQAHPERC